MGTFHTKFSIGSRCIPRDATTCDLRTIVSITISQFGTCYGHVPYPEDPTHLSKNSMEEALCTPCEWIQKELNRKQRELDAKWKTERDAALRRLGDSILQEARNQHDHFWSTAVKKAKPLTEADLNAYFKKFWANHPTPPTLPGPKFSPGDFVYFLGDPQGAPFVVNGRSWEPALQVWVYNLLNLQTQEGFQYSTKQILGIHEEALLTRDSLEIVQGYRYPSHLIWAPVLQTLRNLTVRAYDCETTDLITTARNLEQYIKTVLPPRKQNPAGYPIRSVGSICYTYDTGFKTTHTIREVWWDHTVDHGGPVSYVVTSSHGITRNYAYNQLCSLDERLQQVLERDIADALKGLENPFNTTTRRDSFHYYIQAAIVAIGQAYPPLQA